MRGLALAFLAAYLSAPAWAQEIGPDEVRVAYRLYRPPSSASFSAEARVVDVPVLVRDHRGNPMPGLVRDDFTLFDDGRPREITSFSEMRGSVKGVSPSGGEAATGKRLRRVALVIDDVAFVDCRSIAPIPNPAMLAATLNMVSAAEKVFRRSIRPGDLVGIFALSKGLLAPFSSEAATALQNVRDVTIRTQCFGQASKLDLFEDVVDYMRRQPGERSIILGARPFFANHLQLDEIILKAIEAGVVIHTVDMRGVGSLLGGDTLRSLAEGTGGTYAYNRNDFEQEVSELVDAPAVSYQLGFSPGDVHDGRYHNLKVSVPAVSHGEIQARPKYYAPTPQEEAKRRLPRPIDLALERDDPRGDLPATVTPLADRTADGESVLTVVVHLDLKRLTFDSQMSRHGATLRLLTALTDSSGNIIIAKEGYLEMVLKDQTLARLSQEGINGMITLPAPAGWYRLRTVIADESQRKITATTQAVHIP